MSLDNSMIYCRCCKNLISSSAKRCPQCGAEDPFYYKKLRKQGNLVGLMKYIVPFLFGLIVVGIIQLENFTAGMIVLIAITVVGYFVVGYLGKQYYSKTKQEFAQHFERIAKEKNNEDPYFNWFKNVPMSLLEN